MTRLEGFGGKGRGKLLEMDSYNVLLCYGPMFFSLDFIASSRILGLR